jgi:hypothetical protein
MRWTYDGSIERFPVKPGQLWDCGLGRVMAHDLYAGLPPHMRADCVFVDPPYNAGAENSYRTKAGLEHSAGFGGFLDVLFARIAAIGPEVCYIECGQKYQIFAIRLAQVMPDAHLSVWPATYFKRHRCVVLRAGPGRPEVDYAGWDEAEIIADVCKNEIFATIADPCMGRGLVGLHAFRNCRRFVGTELNPARLAVLLNRIHSEGGHWYVDGSRYEPQPGEPGAVGADRKGLCQSVQPEHGGADRDGAALPVDPP